MVQRTSDARFKHPSWMTSTTSSFGQTSVKTNYVAPSTFDSQGRIPSTWSQPISSTNSVFGSQGEIPGTSSTLTNMSAGTVYGSYRTASSEEIQETGATTSAAEAAESTDSASADEMQEKANRFNRLYMMGPTLNEAVRKKVITEEDKEKYINDGALPADKQEAFDEFCKGLALNKEVVDEIYINSLTENEEGEKVAPERLELAYDTAIYDGIITDEERARIESIAEAEAKNLEESEEADKATEESKETEGTEEAKEAEKAEAQKKAEAEGKESPEHAKAVNDTKAAMRAIFQDLQEGDVVDINKHPEILGDSQRVELYDKFIDDIMEDGNLGKSGKSNLLAHCGIYAEAAESAKGLALKKDGKIKVKDAKSGREGYIDKVQDNHDEEAKFDIDKLDEYKGKSKK